MVKPVAGAGRLLGFESEGDVIFLVWLQFVRGQLESLHVGALLELESDGLVLAPAGAQGRLHTCLATDPGQDWLAGHLPRLHFPLGGGGAGDASVGVGGVVTPVAGVGAPAGVTGPRYHSVT